MTRLLVWLPSLTCAGAIASCSASDAADPGTPGDTTSSYGGGGNGFAHEVITFSDSTTLVVAPSGVAQITVKVEPARRQTVTFEILSDADPFDGFLAGNTVIVGDDGLARVELHAPSDPAEFEIRASLPSGVEARRPVAVSDQGSGFVVVSPKYEGKRDVQRWYASAWPGLSCEDLDSLFMDGANSASGEKSATIADVQAGTLFAVSLRGDQVSAGCVTIPDLATDERLEVVVPVTDRPINTKSGVLELVFGFDAANKEFGPNLQESIAESSVSFAPDATSEAEALLKLTAAELPTETRQALEMAVDTPELTAAVADRLGSPTAISDTLRSILAKASADMIGQELFSAELTLNDDQSKFSLLTVSHIDAALTGFEVLGYWQVAVESGDTLSLGGEVQYDPIQWMCAIAERQAEDAQTADPLAQLEAALSCPAVVESLQQALPESALQSCDQQCFLDACLAQASVIWDRTRDSGQATTLLIAASASAEVHGEALVQSLKGSWRGKTGGSTLQGELAGNAQ